MGRGVTIKVNRLREFTLMWASRNGELIIKCMLVTNTFLFMSLMTSLAALQWSRVGEYVTWIYCSQACDEVTNPVEG